MGVLAIRTLWLALVLDSKINEGLSMKKLRHITTAAIITWLALLECQQGYGGNAAPSSQANQGGTGMSSPDSVQHDSDLPIANALELMKKNQYEEARLEFSKFLRRDENVVRAIVDMGNSYTYQGAYLDAVPYYKVAVSLGSVSALKYLAVDYLQLGQLEEFSKIVTALKSAIPQDLEIAKVLIIYAMRANDEPLFNFALSQLTDEFLTQNPKDIDGVIFACDYFKKSELKQKYLDLQKSVVKPPAASATPVTTQDKFPTKP